MTSLPGPKNVSTTSTPAEVREGFVNKVESNWRGTTFLRNWAFTKQNTGWLICGCWKRKCPSTWMKKQVLYQLGLWVLAHGSSGKSYLQQPMGFHFGPKWRVHAMPKATSALRGVSSLVRLKPHPTMVLVCSNLDGLWWIPSSEGPVESLVGWLPDLGVSKNYGIPKSSILIRFSTINHPFWGTPIFGNTQIYFWYCWWFRKSANQLRER